ncbi:30687_t:CDS:1 [Gigaspora margarita]|uniref:30687_t:CDS:1 n=1 Tax=Gigaspora margarita TaxID=4874 RepID=A0ABN7VD65_GIGMA|nr:30687_t:CDS:1 [Gigaspora margarita]
MNTNEEIPKNNSSHLPLSELNYNFKQLFTYQLSISQQLLKLLQEQNEIFVSQEIDDQNNSSEENLSNQPKKRRRDGPKRDPDNVDEINLLIEEIINLSNPAFVGNNNSFIENQNMVLNRITRRVGSGILNYNTANLVAQIFKENNE